MHRPNPLAGLVAPLAALALLLCVPVAVPAQTVTLAPPQNVVSISASATTEVTKDLLAITFGTTREGADAGTVQAQLKQALDAALAEAKKVARPGQVEVQTGNFALYPRYSPKGGLNGWQGSAELVVQGQDTVAISQLAGRLATMTVSRVAFSLSREARDRVEADVSAQAVQRFQHKAEQTARQFGFGNYTLREVSVALDTPPSGAVPMFRAATAARSAGDEPLPVEAGKQAVTATVSGSVQLTAK